MAISLVALGHTNQGIIHRAWWGASTVGLRLDAAIYSFHMPAFFFVSGIFLRASVEKRGPLRFTIERLRTIIYPYLVWSILGALSVKVLARFVMQKPPTLPEFVHGFLTGTGIWFLPTLFLCLIFGMVLRRLPRPAPLAVALVVFFLHPVTGINFVDRAFDFFPFLAAGMWVSRSFEYLERISRAVALILGLALCVLIVVLTGMYWGRVHWIFLPAGYLGTLMLMLIARSLGRSGWTRILAWIGEASLAVYLVGEYGQGAARQLLVWAHIFAPYPQLIIPTLPAILVPAWLYQKRIRLHIGWLFVAPFGQQQPRQNQQIAKS